MGRPQGAGVAHLLLDEEDWWSALKPGSFVVLSFEGDDIKHEMLLTWKEDRGRLGSVYTPDADHYVLDLAGDRPDAEVVELDVHRRLPRGIGEVYRFRRVPNEAVTRRLFERGKSLLEEEILRERRSCRTLPRRLEVRLPGGRTEMFGDAGGDAADDDRTPGRRPSAAADERPLER